MVLEGSKGSIFLRGVRGPSGKGAPKSKHYKLTFRFQITVSQLPYLFKLNGLQVDWCVHLNII